jgi:putative molybdopterin biosynthesis protein
MSTELMSTREVADYLRIKERKVYDLVRARKIPCSRVTGNWLFPRDLVDRWVAQNTEFAETGAAAPPPPVVAGSHDPLLDWAVRESHCGLALMPGGSLDGLKRLAAGEATLAGLHVIDSETGAYNVPAIAQNLRGRDIVAVTWAEREQGLVVAPGNPQRIDAITALRGRKIRLATRQPEAGAQILLLHLLADAGIKLSEITTLAKPALNETDLGLSVLEGKADAGVAVRAVAQQYRLDFVPLARERFDLVMHRRDFFEPPVQKLLAFAATPAFRTRAQELGGYDVKALGRVVYNA